MEKTSTVASLVPFDPNDRWTQARLDLIRKTICHPSMTEPEIALFLEQCRRTGADPMLGQAFCVPRRVKLTKPHPSGKGVIEEWADRYVFQMSEEGMADRCADFPDYKGIRFSAFFEKDAFKVDPFTGEISHVCEPGKDRGRLRGAWALVNREGHVYSPEILYVEEYEQRTSEGQLTKAWQKRVTMITKCARAAARRRAYPKVFSGVYAQEELALEALENAPDAEPSSPIAPESKSKSLRSKIDAKLKAIRGEAAKELPAPATVTLEAPGPRPTPAKVEAPQAEAKSEPERLAEEKPIDSPVLVPDEPETKENPKLTFGDWKGKPIRQLDTDTLIGAIAYAEDAVGAGKVDGARLTRVKWEIEQIEAELKKREADQ